MNITEVFDGISDNSLIFVDNFSNKEVEITGVLYAKSHDRFNIRAEGELSDLLIDVDDPYKNKTYRTCKTISCFSDSRVVTKALKKVKKGTTITVVGKLAETTVIDVSKKGINVAIFQIKGFTAEGKEAVIDNDYKYIPYEQKTFDITAFNNAVNIANPEFVKEAKKHMNEKLWLGCLKSAIVDESGYFIGVPHAYMFNYFREVNCLFYCKDREKLKMLHNEDDIGCFGSYEMRIGYTLDGREISFYVFNVEEIKNAGKANFDDDD